MIVGAGAQGGPCASILAGEEGVSEIRLGDIDLGMARNVADKINSTKIQPIRLDASLKDNVIQAAEGVDIIINFTLLKYAGSGKWSYEEDIYNPAHFGEMVKGYLKRKEELAERFRRSPDGISMRRSAGRAAISSGSLAAARRSATTTGVRVSRKA